MVEELIEKIHKTLDEHWEYLKSHPNVLNVAVGKKFVKGKDTGVDCITVYVSKKVKKKLLGVSDLLPKEIYGVPVDVVELSSDDFELGETSVSVKPPKVQRIIAGGVRKE